MLIFEHSEENMILYLRFNSTEPLVEMMIGDYVNFEESNQFIYTENYFKNWNKLEIIGEYVL